MNKQQYDILKLLIEQPFKNQRELSQRSNYSLGLVNQSIKQLILEGYLTQDIQLTSKTNDFIKRNRPKRAVILAAGFGLRMIPIHTEIPKALLEVKGEKLIERQIKQLHEVGIYEIHVVVGFMKEEFEYLIDEYGVELIVNPEYGRKNNLYSLYKAINHIENAYIIPCDVWCSDNPFQKIELYAWYMVSDEMAEESDFVINGRGEIKRASKDVVGNAMIGISYITKEIAEKIKDRMSEIIPDKKYNDCFWETVLYEEKNIILEPKLVSAKSIIEINTYEQLRAIDDQSEQLHSEAIDIIAETLQVSTSEIHEIKAMKKGMTNRSFLFQCRDQKYIMRIPGEGTSRLINRKQEAKVYDLIKGKGLCDAPIYMNSDNGYKITTFLEDVRVCNPYDKSDLIKCMTLLKKLHNLNLQVEHDFDIYEQIEFYEKLRGDRASVYKDYEKVKQNIWQLKDFIVQNEKKKVLVHIDANHDNFLFYKTEDGEKLQLTDWEYAGMQDPDVDIAMFCIYALYDLKSIDELIDIYYENNCADNIRVKIYCYVAACGLLWSNWCEYKNTLGIEFGEYSIKQYRYAKDYYKLASEKIERMRDTKCTM